MRQKTNAANRLKKQRKEILEEFERGDHYSNEWLFKQLTLIDKEIKKYDVRWTTLFTQNEQ